MRPGLLCPLLAIAVSGCATAPAPVPAVPPQVAGLTPSQVVAARGAAFQLSAATFSGMKRVVDAGGDVKPLAFGARGLARWARTIPVMFPEGSNLATSRAKPLIWQERADFESKAADYASAATRLAELADAGDQAGFATQWAAVGKTCSACHDLYRAEAAAR